MARNYDTTSGEVKTTIALVLERVAKEDAGDGTRREFVVHGDGCVGVA